MRHRETHVEPAHVPEPVPERWAVTRLDPGCPQCGGKLVATLPDHGPSWYADCEPHTAHCGPCDLNVRAYFSVHQHEHQADALMRQAPAPVLPRG